MTYTSDDDVRAIAEGLIARTLPHEAWTHGAHWAAAFWLLYTRKAAAYTDMPGIIRAYNLAVGTPNTDHEGYHETITLASLRCAEQTLGAAPGDTRVHALLNSFLSGPQGKPDWILAYWSKPVLFSPLARRHWVAPDLAAPAWLAPPAGV